jgi:hypothetical protein
MPSDVDGGGHFFPFLFTMNSGRIAPTQPSANTVLPMMKNVVSLMRFPLWWF